MRLLIIFLFISSAIFGQVCNVCPSGTTTTLSSSFSPTAAHEWVCTNGFTSNLVNPTFNPTENCKCYLTVNDGLCIAKDTVDINVCNCENSPCLGLSYNDSNSCLTFSSTGTVNSPIATDVKQYKREGQSVFTNLSGSQLCGCDTKATLSVTPYCGINGSNFNLGYNATLCPGSTISSYFWNANNGTTIFGSTSSNFDFITIAQSNFSNIGNGGLLTIFATVPGVTNKYLVSKIRFNYSGSGSTCSSITSTVLSQGTYYYDFDAIRIVTYSNGCTPDTCTSRIELPQNNLCQVDGYIGRSNFGSQCSPDGLFLSVSNMTSPITYQWSYNGANVPNNPSTFTAGGYCLVGQPYGEYCCTATDANGCQFSACNIYQATCTANVNIQQSGSILTANPSGCTGTATYTWEYFNGSNWINVGSSQSYNTNNIGGQYKVTLNCSGPPSCIAQNTYFFTSACNVSVQLNTTGSTFNAIVSGCSGSNIQYVWQFFNGTAWTQVKSITTASTSDSYTAGVSGQYRILVSCNGCSAQNQTSITLQDPCLNFSGQINGQTNGICAGSQYFFNSSFVGGATPVTVQWYVNNVFQSSGSTLIFNRPNGNYTINALFTDAIGCTSTATKNINVVTCCSVNASLSPINPSICNNVSQSFSVVPSGGVGPYNVIWTSQLGSNPAVSQGSGTSTSVIFSNAGTYTITATITDANGCVALRSTNLTVTNCASCNCNPSIVVNGNCNLIVASSGTDCSGYDYQLQYSPNQSGWTTISSGSNFSGFSYPTTQNGNYRIVIAKAGCPGLNSQVTVNCVVATCSSLPTVSLNGNSTTQCGLNPVVVSGNTFGGSATQVILSHNGSGTLSQSTFTSSPFSFTYTPNAVGTVTITATTNNPNGAPCQPASSTYNITTLSNPTVTITSPSTSLCVGQSRNLIATPAGGAFTVVSGPGSIVGNTLTANGSGSISISYTVNSNGCNGSASQVITAVANPSNPTMTVDCSLGFGFASITVTAPTGLEYKLDAGSFQTSNTFTNVSNGNHLITVRNTSGCESSGNISVNCGCANNPNITLQPNGSICGANPFIKSGNTFTGATLVSANHNGSGTLSQTSFSSSPFTFTYNPSSVDIGNTVIITFTSNNPAGSPCVSDLKTYQLAVLANPTASISGPSAICSGQNATYTASGGNSYTWSNGSNTNSITINSSATYSITATSSNGCTSTASKTLVVNSLPTVSITSSNSVICQGFTRTLTASPSGGTWSITGQGSITGNAFTASSVGTANITYTYTDANGCVNSAIQSIQIDANPSAIVANVDCSLGFGQGKITVTSPLGLEYKINSGSYQTNANFTNIANGSYTVYAKNASGCEIFTSVSVNCGCANAPTLSLAASSTVCGNGSKIFSGNTFGGSATQVILSHNGSGTLSQSTFTSSPFSFTYTPSIGEIGNTITFTATTNNPSGAPCQSVTINTTLQSLTLPTAGITGPSSFCPSVPIQWLASGGNSYNWSNSLGTNPNISLSSANTYTVTVTGTNGCTSTASKTLTQNTVTIPTITSSLSDMCSGSTRTLTASPVGGIWSVISGNSTLQGNVLTANSGNVSFQYTYTDNNGCITSTTGAITISANPSVPTITTSCVASNSSSAIVTSPIGAFTYSLNGGSFQSGTTFTNIPNGNNILTVQNPTGCTSTLNFSTLCSCTTNPSINLPSNSGSVCGANQHTISNITFNASTQVSVTHNGNGTLSANSFTSAPFSITYFPTQSDIGNNVTITFTTNNPNGIPCSPAVAIYTLNVKAIPIVSIQGPQIGCAGSQINLSATGASTYLWSTGATGSFININAGASVTVTGTATNGCTNSASINTSIPNAPFITISTAFDTICSNSTMQLFASPSGGTWSIISGPATVQNGYIFVPNDVNGTAVVRYTYTDQYSCIYTKDKNIIVGSLPLAPTVSFTCNDGLATITVTAPIGFKYSLDDINYQTSNIFNNVPSGFVYVYAKSPIGCRSGSQININCPSCDCNPNITITSPCKATASASCPGYSTTWLVSYNNINYSIAGTANTQILNLNRYYKVLYEKSGCANKMSNVIFADQNNNPTSTNINLTTIGNHISDPAWGIEGVRYFSSATTLPITATTAASATELGGGWYSPTGAFPTRMNKTAVKPINSARSYSFVVPSNGGGSSIGFAADDIGEMCINGTVVFSLINETISEPNFKKWYILDRVISPGDLINITYQDVGGVVDGTAFEIYSSDYSVLQGSTHAQINAEVKFHTRLITAAQFFVCPANTRPAAGATNCGTILICKCLN